MATDRELFDELGLPAPKWSLSTLTSAYGSEIANDLILAQLYGKTPQEQAYQNYIDSEEWRARSARAKERADHRCQLCYSPGPLHTHHRTYERLGNERDSDLTVLCETCHELFHQHRTLQR